MTALISCRFTYAAVSSDDRTLRGLGMLCSEQTARSYGIWWQDGV